MIYGVGINDINEMVFIDGKPSTFYNTWRDVLRRCYSNTYQEKFPTYIGCTICDEWIYLSNFKSWFEQNYISGFDLDKDLLYNGNKVYSPNTCRYVPHALNTLLVDCGARKGQYPNGVSWCQRENNFRAYCSIPPIISNRPRYNKHIGYYSTQELATTARNNFKADLIVNVGIAYYQSAMIEYDILDSLISFSDKLKRMY